MTARRPPKPIRKSSRSAFKVLNGRHRFEHWYVDNQVYFITACCRDRFPAFASEDAKAVFWDRFEFYAERHGFEPWITSLLDNHYHTMGHLRRGEELPQMMRRIHGSVAKLVNDLLPKRLVPFWRGDDGHDYFDGCLRDQVQGRRTWRYILLQPRRHGVCRDYHDYPHTRIRTDIESAIDCAVERNAFLEGVPYKRYLDRGR